MIRSLTMLGIATCLVAQVPAQEPTAGQGRSQDRETATQAPQKDQDILARYNGSYRIASGRSAGQDVPKDRLDTRVTIQGNVMTVFDREAKELYVVAVRPAPKTDDKGQLATPGESEKRAAAGGQAAEKGKDMGQRIILKTTRSTRPGSEGTEARGLIRAEGDTVTLVYDYSATGQFPEGFVTRTDSQHLFVLRKEAGSGDAVKSGSQATKKDQR